MLLSAWFRKNYEQDFPNGHKSHPSAHKSHNVTCVYVTYVH